MGQPCVTYHPRLGFLVDECAGGAWSEDRARAKIYGSHQACDDGLKVAIGNGLDREVAEHSILLDVWL